MVKAGAFRKVKLLKLLLSDNGLQSLDLLNMQNYLIHNRKLQSSYCKEVLEMTC